MKAIGRMGSMAEDLVAGVIVWMISRDKTDAAMIGFIGGFGLAAAMAMLLC